MRYDVILDNVSSLPLGRLRGALAARGILVLNGGGSPGHILGPVAGMVRAMAASAFVSQRLRPLPSRQDRAELLAVAGLIGDGKLMPVVDRTCPLADTADGLRTVEHGHTRGKIVVTVAAASVSCISATRPHRRAMSADRSQASADHPFQPWVRGLPADRGWRAPRAIPARTVGQAVTSANYRA